MGISLNGVLLEIWAGRRTGLWSEACSLFLLSQLEESRQVCLGRCAIWKQPLEASFAGLWAHSIGYSVHLPILDMATLSSVGK